MNYFAFISYTGADRRWAAWLHRNLEYYKIPTGIMGERSDAPKNLRPIFWYKKDLSGTVLSEALRRELDDSRFLVVICSPEAAKSVWVNDEVKRFIDTGRADRIIPFVVKGEPHAADHALECLPPALRDLPREHEIRAICVADQGRRHALVDTVATMLGVRFDALWQRYRRHRRRMACIWAAVAALLLAIGLFAWDYTRERASWFNTYVDVYGVPQGLEELTPEEVAHRTVSLRFTYRRTPFGEPGFYSWRLHRIEAVNSAGTPGDTRIDDIYAHPVLQFDYADGKLDRVTGKDFAGRNEMIYSIRDDYDGTPAGIIDLGGVETTQASGYLKGASGIPNLVTRSKIKRLHLTRDGQGRIIKKTYHSNNDDDLAGSAIADEHDIFGMAYTYDAEGHALRVDYLGYDGHPTANRYGVAAQEFEHKPKDFRYVARRILNIDNEPIIDEGLIALERISHDCYGNVVGQRFFDTEGNPCYGTANYSIRIIELDDRGLWKSEKTFSPDSVPVVNSQGYAVQECDYDGKGRVKAVRNYDENGELAAAKDGYAETRYSYNSRNLMTETSYYDKEGKPATDATNGFHRAEFDYDSNGYDTETRCFDEDDKPAYDAHGVSITRYEYDPYHRVTSVSYFAPDGSPCSNDQFYHRMELTYDSRGNRVKEEFFDNEGRRTLCKERYAVYELGYDNAGNLVSFRTFDTDYKPIYIDNYVTLRYEYTPNGLLCGRRTYNAADSLTLNIGWTAIELYEYDAAGHLTAMRYFDADSLPCINKDDKVAVKLYTNDERGNCIVAEYFVAEGKRTLDSRHCSKLVRAYDEKRNLLSEEYFGTDDEPVVSTDGYHRVDYVYDKRNNVIETSYTGIDGRPTLDNNGVARRIYGYNARGLRTKEAYFGRDGNPAIHREYGCELSLVDYDSHGREISLSRCRADGSLMKPEQATYIPAREEYIYDERGGVEKILYYDADGNLSRLTGYAVQEISHDHLGRALAYSFYDAEGKPIGGPNFYARLTREYFSPDSMCTTFYDNNLRHVVNITETTCNGNLLRMFYTDSVGNLMLYNNPTIVSKPFAMSVHSYDKHGNSVASYYFGADGQLLQRDLGYASERRLYDELGRLVEMLAYDAHGERCNAIDTGVSHVLFKYDDFGNVVEQSWLDADDKPAVTPWAYWKVNRQYAPDGELLKVLYTLPDGRVSERMPQSGAPQGDLPTAEVKEQIPEEMLRLVLCSVEGPGQMWNAGYKGLYVVLQFEDWITGESNLDKFAEVIGATRGKKKHLVLWRFDENDPEGGEIFEETFSEEPLTARFMDQSCPNDVLPRLAAAKLAQWRAAHPQ